MLLFGEDYLSSLLPLPAGVLLPLAAGCLALPIAICYLRRRCSKGEFGEFALPSVSTVLHGARHTVPCVRSWVIAFRTPFDF